MVLKKLGFSCEGVNNGVESLQAIQKDYWDIVFMDCQMPVMDGYEATAAIRENPDLADIPVIAVSASVVDFDSSDPLFNGSLTKPFRIQELEREVGRFLKFDPIMQQPEGNNHVETAPRIPLTGDQLTKVQLILESHSKESGNLSEASELGQKIEELGVQEKQATLTRIGKELKNSAEKFDILNVEQLQAELKRFLQVGNDNG